MKIKVEFIKKSLIVLLIILVVLILTVLVSLKILNRNSNCIQRKSYSVCFSEEYELKKPGPSSQNTTLSEDEQLNLQIYDTNNSKFIISVRDLFKSNIYKIFVDQPIEGDDKWRYIASYNIPQAYTYDSTEKKTISGKEFYVVRYQGCDLPQCDPIEQYGSVYVIELNDRYVLFYIDESLIKSDYFEKNVLSKFKLKNTD